MASRKAPNICACRDGHRAGSMCTSGDGACGSADLLGAFAAMTIDGGKPGRAFSARLDAADITGAGTAGCQVPCGGGKLVRRSGRKQTLHRCCMPFLRSMMAIGSG